MIPGLYPHTVTIEPVTARDQYGAASSYGAEQKPRALVVPKKHVLYRGSGEETVSRGSAICEGPLAVAADSVVTFPASFGYPARMRVLETTPYPDPLTGEISVVEVHV